MNARQTARAPWLAVLTVVSLVVSDAAAAGQRASGAPALPIDTVTGRVIDSDERPVASALVAILDLRSFDVKTCPGGLLADRCFERLLAAGVVRAQARTGGDGGFALEVPGGLSSADSVWAQGLDATGSTMRTSWSIVPNRKLPTSTLGDIRLNRRLDFIVIVQGDGHPVADARVDFGNGNVARTDGSGSAAYTLQIGAGRVHVAFTVRASGFASDEWAGGVPAGTTTHVVTLLPESPLSGRILDGSGRPVPGDVAATRVDDVSGVGIHTNNSSAPDRTVGTATADASGAFVLHGLRAGERYRLTITAGERSVGNGERTITAGAGSLDIVLGASTPVTLAISGLADDVLMRQNELRPEGPGPGISLEYLDPRTGEWLIVSSPRHVRWVGSDGAELRFDQVPSGPIRIVTRGDFRIATDVSDSLTVTAGNPAIVPLRVAENRELRLQVRDSQGRPVSGARVEVFSHTGRSSSYSNTGVDGSITFRVHPAHDLKVTVSISGTIVATTIVHPGSEQPPPIVVPAR